MDIPNYFLQEGTNDLTLLGVSGMLARCATEGDSFEEFLEKTSEKVGVDEEGLTPYQIRQMVKQLEKDQWLRVIKLKNSYQVHWLPKAFG
ncbi:hypothetical protein [Bacillus sp. B15-48]|uniref:hypothetical protein n=1 Tax=Bacillus sp. B15-48 TaxID=1548601 RepID=UPI00193F84C0|nr:hypothetical protein [Bacillus sp. B15-48]MBM4763114.1 hypothetical protein [Bacillus sp. B15-48]